MSGAKRIAVTTPSMRATSVVWQQIIATSTSADKTSSPSPTDLVRKRNTEFSAISILSPALPTLLFRLVSWQDWIVTLNFLAVRCTTL
jgi:hypothetical protein